MNRAAAERVFFFHPDAGNVDYHDPDYPFVHGAQTSTLQAAARLRAAGYPCALVDRFGEPGIYLQHPKFRKNRPPSQAYFLVSIRNDCAMNRRAQAEIVQNPYGADPTGLQPRFFVPYYPQLGLVPRNHEERGERFEHVVYFGRIQNLHSDLQSDSYEAWMREHGMTLHLRFDESSWADYSDVDAVLAIRDYESAFSLKPANKLVNAWRAGVPALLGPESSFSWYRESDLDYFEIRSLDQLKTTLLRLQRDVGLRKRIRENAEKRADTVSFESVTREWSNTIETRIKPIARRWFASLAFRLGHRGRVRLCYRLEKRGLKPKTREPTPPRAPYSSSGTRTRTPPGPPRERSRS